MKNKLEEYIGKGYRVNLYSSVFIELTHRNPSITIWINNNELNITSTNEYYSNKYFNKNAISLFDIKDYETVFETYKICFSSYTTSDDDKIIAMNELFNNKKLNLV